MQFELQIKKVALYTTKYRTYFYKQKKAPLKVLFKLV